MRIRSATPEDLPAILNLIRGLAVYEREPDAVLATEEMLHEHLFTPGAVARCLIAEVEEDSEMIPAGFALYFRSFSTWLGKAGLYLEDLFVEPDYRGRGIGKALLQELARSAVAQGCGRLEWAVLDWNESAIGFYKKLGAVPMDEWTTYRLTGEALTHFASYSD